MGDISTVLWYRGLLQSLWSTGTLRDWGHKVGGGGDTEEQRRIQRDSERMAEMMSDGLSQTHALEQRCIQNSTPKLNVKFYSNLILNKN